MIYVPDPVPITIVPPATLPRPNPLFHDLVDWHHKTHCRSNHIDVCGYEYESWSDPERTKMTYSTKRSWAEQVHKWLLRDDIPSDSLMDAYIKYLWNSGMLTPEILGDTYTSWKARH